MSDLNRLFYWHGIAQDYYNYRGELVNVTIENRRNLLSTMGVDVGSEMALTKAAFEVDVAPWLCWLAALITQGQENETVFEVNLHPAELEKRFSWELKLDGSTIAEKNFYPYEQEETGDYQFQNTRYTRRRVYMGEMALKPGYYQLFLRAGEKVEEACYAVIPPISHQPALPVDVQKKTWGLIVQLYTIRSESNWGFGDFSDLLNLIERSAQNGMDVIGLNPLHALLPQVEENCSPYSPSDRRFINPLYLSLEKEPDFVDSGLISECASGDFKNRIQALRDTKHVDYLGVKTAKYAVFQKMYQWFKTHHLDKNTQRGRDFNRYVEEHHASMLAWGLYEAMYNRWPEAAFVAPVQEFIWRLEPDSEEFKKMVSDNRTAVLFHIYLQWLCEAQLSACQRHASECGMALGLIRDLAVGANGSGCEVKSNPGLFCTGASVGAPPDPFSDLGQNWGIPPMDPAAMRQTGYRHYIDLLRANMFSCGALRIDHAMSLLRLWWCPPDYSAAYGAYVYYPFEDLLGLLKLESHLNHCVIIGEDLGVVPPEFREGMARAKIFANKVFYFEKEGGNCYKSPRQYDEHALAMVNNHDVPTLKSWWDGSDLKLRDKLNLFEEGVDYDDMCSQRVDEKRAACELLKDEALLPVNWQKENLEEKADADLIHALLEVNARGKSDIFVIQLEDLLAMDEPTNVPGTFKEYPNWQRKISANLEAIFSSDNVVQILKKINEARKI